MPGIVRSAFENQGEICLCGSRLFVEAPLFDDSWPSSATPSGGCGSATRSTRRPTRAPSSRRRTATRSSRYIDLSREHGGAIVTGGEPPRQSAGARAATATSSSRPSSPACRWTAGSTGGDLRPGRDGDAVPAEAEAVDVGERHAVRAVGLGLDARPAPRPPRRRAPSTRARSGSTPGCCATCACRSAA